MRNGTKDSDKAHRLVSSRFCAAVECLVGEPNGPVVALPRNRPRHAVHLAAALGSALLWSVWWETPRVLLSRSLTTGLLTLFPKKENLVLKQCRTKVLKLLFETNTVALNNNE